MKLIVLLAILVCLIPEVSWGQQCCPYIDNISISPADPTASDSITVTFTVTTPNLGAYLGETHTINGDTVVINACYFNGMLTALQTYVDSITVAPMPVGNHFVRLQASISDDMSQCIPTQFQDSIFSFSVLGGGASICDSVFISPDTIYVYQPTDTSVNVSLTFTGQSDVSYSMISFIFNDSTYLDINDFGFTNGISGPFSYTWHYDITYNQVSIPNNTVVPAEVWIYHQGLIGLPPSIDCKLPITLVVLQSSEVKSIANSNISVYPNPTENMLTINGLTELCDIVIYDAMGKPVLTQTSSNINTSLNVSQLSQGIYAVAIHNSHGVCIKRFSKL